MTSSCAGVFLTGGALLTGIGVVTVAYGVLTLAGFDFSFLAWPGGPVLLLAFAVIVGRALRRRWTLVPDDRRRPLECLLDSQRDADDRKETAP